MRGGEEGYGSTERAACARLWHWPGRVATGTEIESLTSKTLDLRLGIGVHFHPSVPGEKNNRGGTMKQFSWMAGVAFLTLSLVSPALAVFDRQVPEIDPSSAGSALALLVSGVLVLTGRRRRS